MGDAASLKVTRLDQMQRKLQAGNFQINNSLLLIIEQTSGVRFTDVHGETRFHIWSIIKKLIGNA